MAKKPTTKKLTVVLAFKFQGTVEHKQLFINDVEMSFVAGKARFAIEQQKNYRLRLIVKGFGGAKCSYSLVPETDGFAVQPGKLSDPGRKFTLQGASMTKNEEFTVAESAEEEES